MGLRGMWRGMGPEGSRPPPFEQIDRQTDKCYKCLPPHPLECGRWNIACSSVNRLLCLVQQVVYTFRIFRLCVKYTTYGFVF